MATRTNARTAMATALTFFQRPDAPPGLCMNSTRSHERVSVFLCASRHRAFCLAAPELGRRFLPGCPVPAALEMDVMNKRRTKRNHGVPRRKRPSETFTARRFLLTQNEAAFFRALTTVVGHRYLVSCKVRLADVITCTDRDWNRGYANRISQKHIDFVVSCAKSSRIVAAIELDDRSHRQRERRRRDAFVNRLFRNARVHLIRIPARWDYEKEVVARHLTDAGLPLKRRLITAQSRKAREPSARRASS